VSHALTTFIANIVVGLSVAVWALVFVAGIAPRLISFAPFIFFPLFSCQELLTVGARRIVAAAAARLALPRNYLPQIATAYR
jgi:hypothetical protein